MSVCTLPAYFKQLGTAGMKHGDIYRGSSRLTTANVRT